LPQRLFQITVVGPTANSAMKTTTMLLVLVAAVASAESWQKLSDKGFFSAREGLMAVSTENGIFLTGGRASFGVGFASDVWRTENGTHWNLVKDNAFPKRAYHNMVYLNKCMYVFGGQTFTEFRNDVWKSCDEGETWVSLGNAPWPARAGAAATIYNNEIIVAGGCYNAPNGLLPPKRSFRGDVWSSPDGVKWTQLSPAAEWSARSGPRLVAFQEKLFLVAGERGFTADVQLKDVWESADGGKTWTLTTDSPGFSARSGHGVVVSSSGKSLMVVAGWPELHDLWVSDDAKNWTQTSDSVWGCSNKSCGKFDFWSLLHKGDLLTMGGSGSSSTFGKLYADTWAEPDPTATAQH